MRQRLFILLALVPALACKDDTSPVTDTEDSSSTASTSSDTTATATTSPLEESTTSSSESSSSTTGPMPCVSDEECTDPDAPFCGTTGECGTCDGVDDPDEACAGVDPAAPVCVDGACVQCTAAAPEACTGKTPVCDDATNTCVPCNAHDQCGEAACNLYTGACLPADAVVHVGGATPDFPTLTLAAASFAAGDEGTIIVHEGMPDYNESVTVDGGRVLAFLAAADAAAPPGWVRTAGGAPQLAVTMGSTVLIDGLRMSGNANDVALMVDSGRVWVDRSRVIGNSGGGVLAENNAELVLRNCFVGQDANDANALEVNGATANVLYSTLGAGTVTAIGLACTTPVSVIVRNSLIVSRGVDATGGFDVVCDEAEVSFTATEFAVAGAGNQAVGEMSSTMPELWFVGYGTGDFHLQNDGLTLFADIAQWNLGDLPTDIDGDPRPAVDSTSDYVGADVPQ
jgi:hypothetical protein